MMEYVKLIETNEHESETWVYFLQLTGNEKNLKVLYEALPEIDPEGEYYNMYIEPISEHDVDVIMKHLGFLGGYMPLVQKISGRCNSFYFEYDELSELLYKGGIVSFFN